MIDWIAKAAKRIYEGLLLKPLQQDGIIISCSTEDEARIAAIIQSECPVDEPREPPLLMCVDCKNTESPAGAMARQFNHGRCVHCGGFFKVMRA